MAIYTATVKPVTAISQVAARLSWAATALFLVLLTALHVIKAEYDPAWRMISEYEIGRHGWVMVLAFLALAFSCVTLLIAIRWQIRDTGGTIGLGFLLVSAVGFTLAGIFTADPITIGQDAVTTHGKLHALGGLLSIFGLPIAATLISRSLARNPAWSSARRPLYWMVSLVWITLVVFALSMGILFRGTFGPDVLIGWPSRAMIVACSGWLMTVAQFASR